MIFDLNIGGSWGRSNFEKFTSLAGRGLLVFFFLLGVGTLIVNSSLMSLQNVLLLLFILS